MLSSATDFQTTTAGLLDRKRLLFKGLMARHATLQAKTAAQGYAASPALQVDETTLYAFVTRRHFLIDRQPFDWQAHQYLVPLYEAFRLEPGNTEGLSLTIIKGAQIGASVCAMLGLLFAALKFPGSWLGYFLPDKSMTEIFSGNRFKPLIESNKTIAPLLGNTGDGEGENSKRLRNVGSSSILFSYMEGKTSTESAPLLGIFFDEVRRMTTAQINLAEERISHSPYPINVKLSTAGYPESDIDYAYRQTDQQEWHTRCQCAEGIVLADVWPECIGFAGEKVFYRCPRCDTRITHPQEGTYVAHGPARAKRGYRIPQTLSASSLHSPAALWAKFTDPHGDRGEFYRSVLGRPYVDPESQLVTEADLIACENTDLTWQSSGVNCAMGIDQRAPWNDVVIKQRAPNGKYRTVHLERIIAENPFGARLDELMRLYDVSLCVTDMLPNYHTALMFARRWAPRVFLCTYAQHDDMIVWHDREKKKHQEPNKDEVKFKYRVTANRYKVLHWSLSRFKERLNEMPHRKGLVQTLPDEHGMTRPVFLCEELYWKHLQRMVSQKEVIDEAQGTFRMVMVNVGLDPHFIHANGYADIALSRSAGGRVALL